MIAVLSVLALVTLASAQFGGQQCDFNRLQEAIQQKEQCVQQFYQQKMQALQGIQRSDRTCFQGIEQTVQQCKQPTENFKQQNDLDTQGIMECCFPGRVRGSGSSRRCEFKNKEDPSMMGMKGGKGKKGGHDRKKRCASGDCGGMSMDPEMERKMKASMTMTDMVLWGTTEMVDMVEHMMWCMEEDRPINDQAMDSYRRSKDQLIAKIFECENIILPVATNCTDIQYQDLECVMKGYSWGKSFMEHCMMACMPSSLESICRMVTGGAGGAQPLSNFFSNNNNNNAPYDPYNSYNTNSRG
jgi:hypothetical protein